LRVALTSVLVSLPFGLLVAWLLARRNFYGKGLLNALVHLPLVLPPVVVGYLLLLLLGRQGPLGRWLFESFGISLPFTWQGAALAAAVMAFPLMVRAMRLTLPLMAPGIVVGILLAFARSLGEFGATITFAANIPGETRTLPLALYSLIQTPGGEAAAARLMLLSLLLSFVALAASELVARRLHAANKG
jgi:molybdate transport system permease protein